MARPKAIASQFEDLCMRIFVSAGLNIRDTSKFSTGVPMALREADFYLIDSEGNTTHAVEVKYYPMGYFQPRLLKEVLYRFVEITRGDGIKGAILVTSSRMPGQFRVTLEESSGAAIVDVDDLFVMAAKDAELLDELKTLLEMDVKTDSRRTKSIVDHIYESATTISRLESKSSDSEHVNYCEQLSKLPPGRESWSEYEDLCLALLKYLFDGELVGWYKQAITDDGLNRFDLVCRIAENAGGVWAFLAHELQSRYVLFEFKNYTDPIGPGEVYSTERYLLTHGKRTVGFLISRKGITESGKKAIQGAMRENGKLIVPLDDNELCKMYRMRNAGDLVAGYLFELVDNFLIELPR